MEKIKLFFALHKSTVILVSVLLVILAGGFFVFNKFVSNKKTTVVSQEVDLTFDAEGPYAILSPRRDGNALVLNLKRTLSYDSISYDLVYTSNVDVTHVAGSKILDDSEGGDSSSSGSIDRAVSGHVDTNEKKGEYEQEILFGSCSKNVCVYDKGVENGTLTLHIKKGDQSYRMNTQWHLQKPDISLGVLTSGDNHLTYKISADRQALSNIGFTIINDLTGVPKLPNGTTILGKVYSLNAPIAKNINSGVVSIELAENPSPDAKIYFYDVNKSDWQVLDTKISGSTLSATATGSGIFAVLTSKK